MNMIYADRSSRDQTKLTKSGAEEVFRKHNFYVVLCTEGEGGGMCTLAELSPKLDVRRQRYNIKNVERESPESVCYGGRTVWS